MCVHRETGAQRAVKVLRKSHMDDDEKRMLFNEINILKEIVSEFYFSAFSLRYLFIKFKSLLIIFRMLGPSKHRENVRVFRRREALLLSY